MVILHYNTSKWSITFNFLLPLQSSCVVIVVMLHWPQFVTLFQPKLKSRAKDTWRERKKWEKKWLPLSIYIISGRFWWPWKQTVCFNCWHFIQCWFFSISCRIQALTIQLLEFVHIHFANILCFFLFSLSFFALIIIFFIMLKLRTINFTRACLLVRLFVRSFNSNYSNQISSIYVRFEAS